MRKVEILKRIYHKTKLGYTLEPTGEVGLFHQFGIDYEEFESGPGMFTTAVVELPDGTVKNIYVENIKFLDKEE